MYWEISPYHNQDADCRVMSAESDEDHHKALEYATERLEQAWDELEPGKTVTVTMGLHDDPMPDIVDLPTDIADAAEGK